MNLDFILSFLTLKLPLLEHEMRYEMIVGEEESFEVSLVFNMLRMFINIIYTEVSKYRKV